VTVTSFDIDALIFHMLSYRNLMQSHNLIFNDGDCDNPFRIKHTNYYGDCHASEFYIQTLKMKERNQETEILVPIQACMDETTLDTHSKLSLHTLVMKVLILNRKQVI